MNQSRLAGGAVGLILIPMGALVFWGGLSGNLAAIIAAFVAQDQLVSTTAHDKSPGSSGSGSGTSNSGVGVAPGGLPYPNVGLGQVLIGPGGEWLVHHA